VTLFKVLFIQDFGLFRVRFRQEAKNASLNGDDGNKTDNENDEVKGHINERITQPKRREGKGFKCEDCNKIFSSKG
jgi:hypothetical protein